MTRDEYKQKAVQDLRPLWSNGIDHIVNSVNFPTLLRLVGEYAFVYPDKVSAELQNETRRRLLQLEQTGVTDP